jgi:hypothetical protein
LALLSSRVAAASLELSGAWRMRPVEVKAMAPQAKAASCRVKMSWDFASSKEYSDPAKACCNFTGKLNKTFDINVRLFEGRVEKNIDDQRHVLRVG